MSSMDILSTGDFLHELAAFKGNQVRVRVIGAGTSQTGDPTGDYVGELSDVYDDCITLTVRQQSVLIRIAAIVAVASPPLPPS